jgi:hypothetical protein
VGEHYGINKHIENKTGEQGKGGAAPALKANAQPNNQQAGKGLPPVDEKQAIREQENALRLMEIEN